MSCELQTEIRNLVIAQGEDWSEVWDIYTGGEKVQLEGSAFVAHIRKTPDGPLVASFSFSIDTVEDNFTISISAATMATIPVGNLVTDAASRYVYDIRWTDAGGEKHVPVGGTIAFRPAVTRGV